MTYFLTEHLIAPLLNKIIVKDNNIIWPELCKKKTCYILLYCFISKMDFKIRSTIVAIINAELVKNPGPQSSMLAI